MYAWLLAPLLVLAAQDDFDDAPPPPPPLDELDAPPPLPRDPDDAATPERPAPRVPDEEAYDDDDESYLDERGADEEPMDVATVRAIQIASGCAAAVVALAITFVPYLGCFAYLLLMPALVATVETVVGEALGQERGALLWPTLAAYGTHLAAGTFFGIAGFGGLYLLTSQGFSILNGFDPCTAVFLVYAGLFGFAAVAGLVWGGLVAIVPAFAFGATAEPKRADDDEMRFPGVLTPNHPPAKQKKKRKRTRTSAMAF